VVDKQCGKGGEAADEANVYWRLEYDKYLTKQRERHLGGDCFSLCCIFNK